MRDPLQDIMEERARQDLKWGANRDLADLEWLAILTEEIGEAAEAVLNGRDRRGNGLGDEVVQVAAVALAWLEALARRTV